MQFKDKFIGFVDILGFESLVKRAERVEGITLSSIQEALDDLGSEADKETLGKYGPSICPNALRIKSDVDFQLTQVSDCVIISTEISPAGVITLINHCWKVVVKLLKRGLMCRGHIRRGTIAHEGARFIGTGYQKAIKQEKVVSVFQRHPEDSGTPFVEIDVAVKDYAEGCKDECVLEMFRRLVHESDGLCAVFPFKRFSTSFAVNDAFNAEEEKRNNDTIRQWIIKMKEAIHSYVDRDDHRAVQKAEHYNAALDRQLKECDRADEMIDMLDSPFPGGRFRGRH